MKQKIMNNKLHLALFYGHLPIVEYLIENIEAQGYYDKNPLHYACLKLYLPIVESYWKRANIETKEKNEATLLPIV